MTEDGRDRAGLEGLDNGEGPGVNPFLVGLPTLVLIVGKVGF
jgi:hypothetical protein